MGFWKKKKKIVKRKNIHIQTIPDAFYGGNDPVIFPSEAQKVDVSVQKKQQRIKPGTSHVGKNGVGRLFQKKTIRYSFFGTVFLIIVAGISFYYIRDAQVQTPNIVSTPNNSTNTVDDISLDNQDEVLTEESNEDDLDIVTPTTTASELPEPLTFPRILLGNSVDLDSDALTDLEEEIFQTDTGIWDTDEDGYFDGQEVYNLYNPKGLAPVKLIDSGLVTEYVNPTNEYRVYYPNAWEFGAVDVQHQRVLFSAITGDFVEIRSFQKNETQTFAQWFGLVAKGELYTDLKPFTNRFKEDAMIRKDELVAYFYTDTRVYVLIYHPGTTGNIPFRHIMQMMYQSFRPNKTFIDIPDQVILNQVPSDTTQEPAPGLETVESQQTTSDDSVNDVNF